MAEITDFGPRKTIFILAIVAGCFAVLWPKIFYPMLTASVTPQHTTDNSGTIKQERRTPPHAGGLHPALRERGRAIPSSHVVPKVADRPDHVVPKMRPPLGGAGHVVPAPKGNGTMGIIMPLYTLGIVLFFLYTIVKVLKKNSDSEIISEYPGAAAEKEFRKMVFSPEAFATAMTGGTMHYQKERSPSPQRPAPTIEELKDLDGPPKSKGLAGVDRSPKDDTAAQAEHSAADEEVANIENSPTVKVMGMEMTASCEGKGSRPTTPIIPISPSHIEREKTPPKPIYLEGALPPQCELLVTDAETQAQKAEEDVEAPVVLSGKMTLSLISLDQNAAEFEEEDREIQQMAEDAQILSTGDTETAPSSGTKNVTNERVDDEMRVLKETEETHEIRIESEEPDLETYAEEKRFEDEIVEQREELQRLLEVEHEGRGERKRRNVEEVKETDNIETEEEPEEAYEEEEEVEQTEEEEEVDPTEEEVDQTEEEEEVEVDQTEDEEEVEVEQTEEEDEVDQTEDEEEVEVEETEEEEELGVDQTEDEEEIEVEETEEEEEDEEEEYEDEEEDDDEREEEEDDEVEQRDDESEEEVEEEEEEEEVEVEIEVEESEEEEDNRRRL